MTRRILINGRRAEEVRVAIVENQTLEDFEIETKHSGLLRNNIYRGVVSNIAPSLNAAFVDFGDVKNGFLAFNDVVESVYAKPVKDTYKIADVLVPGQELIVQVIKDATTLKGAQVTTNISLAGRYLVLRPKDAKSGVSRKVDEDARADLTQKVRSLDLPEGYGCIVRTNAMDQSRSILLRDAKALVQLWHKIETEAGRAHGPQLLYNDQDIVVSVMRDYYDSTINEVLIDDKSCYERAATYVRATCSNCEDKVRLYTEKMPLFSRFGIEKQIDQIYARTVWLPSGGFIVIDPTEALTAIDVNSAHATKRENQDLTAYHTNLEAAVEIGRQLRMRDIGGLIVVDFIDMRSGKHQRDVERVMRNAMMRDKARNKVERISANGLLEINRQRISQALSQRTHLECPTCGGRGFIPSAEAIAMNLIREIDARAANGNLGGVVIKLHPDIAQQLQNERRREFAQIESEYNIRIEIVATREMSRGEEEVEWLTPRQNDAKHPEKTPAVGDAASIIDVAEVYQNQDEDDDAYRPNDFEEYSSEDARKRRASRRASRRACACEAKAAVCEECEAEKLAERAEDSRKSNRDAELRADKDERKGKNISASDSASGLALLGALIDKMQPYINEPRDEENHRRSRRFGARRRASKRSEAGTLTSDLRMFTLDITKAVLTQGLEADSDISRREMIERMPEAAEWLVDSSRLGSSARCGRIALIRNVIASKHASARLTYIFEGNTRTQADEMATLLADERSAVFADDSRVDDRTVEALKKRIEVCLARVFEPKDEINDEQSAPASFDTTEIESGDEDAELEDALDALIANVDAVDVSIHRPIQADAAVKAASMNASHRRPRRHVRVSIGDPLADTAQNPAISPFFADNEPVVTSETTIEPMTVIDDEKNEEDQATAITQELPAVSRERRPRRERRKQTAEPSADENAMSETSAEADDNADSSVRRERRTRRAKIGDASDAAETAPVTEMPIQNDGKQVKADEPEVRPHARRTRRERTAAPASAAETPVVTEVPADDAAAVEAAPAADDAPVKAEPRTRRTRRSRAAIGSESAEAEAPAAAEVPAKTEIKAEAPATAEVKAEVPAETEKKDEASAEAEAAPVKSTRRVRRTRRVESGDFAAPVVDPAAAAVPVEVSAESEAPVKSDKPAVDVIFADTKRERRTRRTRRPIDGQETAENKTQSNAGENVPAAVDVTKAAPAADPAKAESKSKADKPAKAESKSKADKPVKAEDGVRSTRRVRRVRAAAINLDDYEKVSAAESGVDAVSAAESVPAAAEPVKSESAAEAVDEMPKTRTRRTRRSAAKAEEMPESAPVREAPADTPESASEPADTPRPRVRRTRRARPEIGE